MDQELLARLDEQDRKLDAIYESAEKTRKLFLWTLIGTALTSLLPIIGLIVAIPWFLSTLSGANSGLFEKSFSALYLDETRGRR